MGIKGQRGGSKPASIEKRFWSKVKVVDNSCWEWQGSKDRDEYGQAFHDQKFIAAHRLSWLVHKGNLPNLFVCHKCDNPSCVNPDHLFLGTNSDNMLDMVKKGRAPNRKGSNHGMAKLNEDKVKEIKRLLSNGSTMYAVAKAYNVTFGTIRNIKNDKTWTHVQV